MKSVGNDVFEWKSSSAGVERHIPICLVPGVAMSKVCPPNTGIREGLTGQVAHSTGPYASSLCLASC